MEREVTTELKIKGAAQKIFLERGFDGARMQDIADEAGVNKAMLNYYFRSKQALFEIIFFEKVGLLFGNLIKIMISGMPFDRKVEEFVHTEITLLSEYPILPIFVVNELHKNPNLLAEKINFIQIDQVIMGLKSQFQKEIDEGKIRDVPFHHFMINLISLCIFPYLARPIIKYIFSVDDESFFALMEERKIHVSNFLLQYLNPEQ